MTIKKVGNDLNNEQKINQVRQDLRNLQSRRVFGEYIIKIENGEIVRAHTTSIKKFN